MENNQFNPQQQPFGGQQPQQQQQTQTFGGQPQQAQQPQQQPQTFGGQPQQAQQPQPQQQPQTFGGQPQQAQQPFGGQQQAQQPFGGQQAFVAPKPAKAPMNMATRTLYIAIALLTTATILYTAPSYLLIRYQENSTVGTFAEFFGTLFRLSHFVFIVATLIIGVALFVPSWSKQLINYVNTRIVLMGLAIAGIVLSAVNFITTLTSLIQLPRSTFSTAPVFSSWLLWFPVALLASIATLVLSLSLPKAKLNKDRFVLSLFILFIVLGVTLFFSFLFFFLGKGMAIYY